MDGKRGERFRTQGHSGLEQDTSENINMSSFRKNAKEKNVGGKQNRGLQET